jgi:hypothetical protein
MPPKAVSCLFTYNHPLSANYRSRNQQCGEYTPRYCGGYARAPTRDTPALEIRRLCRQQPSQNNVFNATPPFGQVLTTQKSWDV